MQFIENATSGSQNIIISQGSGANITIPPGDTKAVYLDGAGSGAAVVDAFASLNVVDLKVEDDLTVTDDASIGGDATITGTLGVSGLLTANANLTLAGTTPTLTIGDAGAEDTKIVFDGNAQDFYIALDDSADDLLVGLGSTVGTTPIISITEAGAVTLKNVGTGDDNPMSLTLQTSETDIAADDVLGKISFQAPDEGTGTDATLVAAAIQAISEGDFSSSSNATSLAFMTGASEAATTKMTLTSAGLLGVGTASPSAICEIVDGGAGSPGTALKVLSNQNSAASDGLVFIHSDQALAPFTALNVRQDGTGDILNLLSGTTEVLTVTDDGLMAIGVSSPHDSNALLTLSKSAVASSVLKSTTNTVTFANVANGSGSEAYSGTATNHPYYLMTNGTERLTIDTSGNATFTASAIIGTNIVQSSTNASFFMGGSTQSFGDTAGIGIAGGDNFHVNGSATGDIVMGAATGENIVLGTASSGGPQNRLKIAADGVVTIGNLSFDGTSSSSLISAGNVILNVSGGILTSGSTSLDLQFQVPVTGVGTSTAAKLDAPTGDWFTNDGSVSSLSDSRLKKDITTLTDGIDIVKQLRPITFKYDDTTQDEDGSKYLGAASETVRYGFVAQEVESVAPQYVASREGKVKGKTVSDLKSLSQTRMIPMLVKSIQELEARITTLEG
jgi:hypothetical protein